MRMAGAVSLVTVREAADKRLMTRQRERHNKPVRMSRSFIAA